jgi:hypothetical protein
LTPTTTCSPRIDRALRRDTRLLDLALHERRSMAASTPPCASSDSMAARRSLLDPIGHLLDRRTTPPHGSTDPRQPALVHRICCVRSAIVALSSVGSAQRLVAAVGVERLRAAEHRRQACNVDAHDVGVGLLRGQRAAGRLRVEAQLLAPGLGGAEPIAHQPAPTAAAPRGTSRFLEEVVVRVEEERQPRADAFTSRPRRRTPRRRRTRAPA